MSLSASLTSIICFFFFQAEDGIRDLTVTGVQTCALPIWGRGARCLGDGRGWLLDRDENHRCDEKQPDEKENDGPHQAILPVTAPSCGPRGHPRGAALPRYLEPDEPPRSRSAPRGTPRRSAPPRRYPSLRSD